jgi:hypothetical protein
MKATTFRFGIQSSADGNDESTKSLTNALRAIHGVEKVSIHGDLPVCTLKVRASFSDADSAKKLHRKIMRAIMGIAGISITEVSTTLTDIF